MKKEKKRGPPAGPGAKRAIPKGWRRMRRNEIIRKGDRFYCLGEWHTSLNWIDEVWKVGECASGPYIRKKARAK